MIVSHFFYGEAPLKNNFGASTIIFFTIMNNYGVHLVYIPENILISMANKKNCCFFRFNFYFLI